MRRADVKLIMRSARIVPLARRPNDDRMSKEHCNRGSHGNLSCIFTLYAEGRTSRLDAIIINYGSSSVEAANILRGAHPNKESDDSE